MKHNQQCMLLLALLTAGLAGGVHAQTPTAAHSAQIAAARQANAALMHQYQWHSRTEILEGGQVKDTRIELVNYGLGGQLQRTTLNDQAARLPIGFLRRAIQENERQKLQTYLVGLRGLIDLYTMPNAGKIYDFMMTAVPAGPDANGQFSLTGQSIVQPGDGLTIWVNPWTRHPTHAQVSTNFQGDTVNVTATFATVAGSGLNYVSFAEATVPSKSLSVQVQNYDYARIGN
jgi:hypothetical protein